jgi:hypothetical protein
LNRAEQLSGLVGRLRQEQQRLVEELHLRRKTTSQLLWQRLLCR